MRQPSRMIHLLLGASIVLGAAPLSAQDAMSCEQDPARRALDFWVGEWDVVDSDGRQLGTNRIDKVQGGCLVEERWSSAAGGAGQSMNYYDPAERLWKQRWVDRRGGVVEYTGGMEDGVLRFVGRHVQRDGTETMARASIERVGEGRLRHLIEHSSDDGDTWSVYFDGTYIPRGGQIASAGSEAMERAGASAVAVPEAANEGAGVAIAEAEGTVAEAAPEEMPDPEPVERQRQEPAAPSAEPQVAPPQAAQPQAARQAEEHGSGVRAVTRELQREEIPEDQAPELVMASPMVLEVEPGDIHEYPENAAWRTEETAGFICNEVKIQRVGIGHETKGDAVDLIVTSRLFTQRRIRKTSLLIELIDDGEVIASAELGNVRVGKNIPAHGNDGMDVTARLRIRRDEFDDLFVGDERPIVRLTLSVP